MAPSVGWKVRTALAILGAAGLAGGCAGTGTAGPGPEPAPAEVPPSPAPPAASDDGPPTVDGVPFVPPGERRVSISFEREELWRVVRAIARAAEANVVCDPAEITGLVTVNIVDTPWRRALETVARARGYAVVVDRGGVTHVVTRERALLLLEPPPEW